MRVGTAFLLPLLALFGFGFFLAYSFTLSRELSESRTQFAQLQAERQILDAQYQALLQEKNRLTGQVSNLSGENESLRRQVNTLATQGLLLSNQVESLQGQLDLAKRLNPLLAWLIPVPSQPGALAFLIVPMVPLSLGAAYIITRRKAINPLKRPAKRWELDPTICQALLTREEFHIILMYRRFRSEFEGKPRLDNPSLR